MILHKHFTGKSFSKFAVYIHNYLKPNSKENYRIIAEH